METDYKHAFCFVLDLLNRGLFTTEETSKVLEKILNKETRKNCIAECLRCKRFENDFDFVFSDIQNHFTYWPVYFKRFLEEVSELPELTFTSRLVHARLAYFLERCYLEHTDRGFNFSGFNMKVGDVLEKVSLPGFLRESNLILIGKRQPSFSESVRATLLRYKKMEEFGRIFVGDQNVQAIILGGSLGYGPFLNVRSAVGNSSSSDLDVIVIVKDFNDIIKNRKFYKTALFYKKAKHQFKRRLGVFQELYKKMDAVVFSQKFDIVDTDFYISIHFITIDTLKSIIGKPFEAQLLRSEDISLYVSDYKAKNKIFFGDRFGFSKIIKSKPILKLENQKIKSGFITFVEGYSIINGRFYPGIYHNIISPKFSVWHDKDNDTTNLVRRFKRVFVERYKMERVQFRDCSHIFNSHLRYPIFSPILMAQNR
ncbi:MAG: hypothetical protein L3J07_01515 [Candidatus Magasanikbacteria bacterium]|nr:hypothetical protein [Candidatus Magasanikbacteria bacterium]